MPLTRAQLRHQAAIARYQSGHSQPPSRKQARAWLAPIRAAFNELAGGEIDAVRGYPITRIHYADEDYARVDHAINGFLALIARLMPDLDTVPMSKVSKKLEAGILMTPEEIQACFVLLNTVEDRLLTFTRQQLKDAAQTEQIIIELEAIGVKEAA